MKSFFDNLKSGLSSLSNNDKNLPNEDIKKIQKQTADLTFKIEESLPTSEQSNQLKTINKLSKMPHEQQDSFTKQYKESIKDSKQRGKINQDEEKTLNQMIDSQKLLLDLMSCSSQTKHNNKEKTSLSNIDSCSNFLGRVLSENEKKEATIVAKNQFEHFTELAAKRTEGTSRQK